MRKICFKCAWCGFKKATYDKFDDRLRAHYRFANDLTSKLCEGSLKSRGEHATEQRARLVFVTEFNNAVAQRVTRRVVL